MTFPRFVVAHSLLGLLLGCNAVDTSLADGAFRLEKGQTKQEVFGILGRPRLNDLKDGVEEWHYCTTEVLGGPDSFLSVFFADSRVFAFKQYKESKGGSCEDRIKGEGYREPDAVMEYRVKFR